MHMAQFLLKKMNEEKLNINKWKLKEEDPERYGKQV